MPRSTVIAIAALKLRARNSREQVRWIIEPLAKQGLPLRDIAKTLNAYRVKTLSGKGKWHNSSVRRVVNKLDLREPGYVGKSPGRWASRKEAA
ncbi:MAG: recombinase family protein [Woeseia sp.]